MRGFKKGFSFIFIFSLFLNLKAFCADLKLDVVYPKNNSTVTANSTFFVGSTEPNAKLTINNQATKVYPNGAFVKVIPLKNGENSICLKSILNAEEKTVILNINAPSKPVSLPHLPVIIDNKSIKPSSDIVYKPGDALKVRFKGSPDHSASFIINDKVFKMKELPFSLTGTKGIYEGSYVISSEDNFKNAVISVKLQSKYTKLTQSSNAKLTTLPPNSFIFATVSKNKASVRSMPYGERLTPLPEGTKLILDGKFDNHYRFKANDSNNWIYQDNISIMGETQEPVISEVKNINVSQGDKDVKINVNLTENMPFSVKEQDNSLTFDIFNTKPNFCKNLCIYDDFISSISWSVPSLNTFRLLMSTKSKNLHGYDYSYSGNNLVVSVNKPPCTDINKPLEGKVIAIDPGHGGSELGSVGPTGVPEKTVNLAISDYLKNELEKAGAKVIMTRITDNENPDLYERPEIARNNGADILVSIHNNALPDGEDPYVEHGTSVYYYYPQAISLATAIKNNLIKDLQYKDLGVLKGSLVLTRVTNPVAVLVEVGFMINPVEYQELITPEFQQKAALSIKNGIEEYFKKAQ
ncbi:MAG: N-acetylmuramoyl-L-alanine amidase [Candidatus Gastranaerophilaceae bacterium]|jgi:N-acetylmuramoyl-L-alanine amidase